MNDRFFVDTNILVYAYDDSAGPKHAIALSLLNEVLQSGAAIISTHGQMYATVRVVNPFKP
jgi:predicted nucleic acid-binding protein